MAANGMYPDSMLVYLGWSEADHLRLVPDAAASINRLAAAFEAHFGKPLYLSDAYRTYAQQVVLKRIKGVFAATPGKSNHGLGLAIDAASRINVDGSAEHRWMEANAGAFGWVNPAWAQDYNANNGQHEPWHWEYHYNLDTKRSTMTPTQENDDMPSAQEVAQAVWTMALGPTGATPAGPAWAHLIAAREAAAGAAAYATAAAAAVGPLETADPHLGPAPLAVFVGDTRTDVMRILDIARGQTAQIAALQAAVSALALGQGADPAAITAAAEAGARTALADLRLRADTP